NDPAFNDVFEANLNTLVGADHVAHFDHMGGCSDFGDVQHIIPAIHPYIGGMVGGGHSSDYQVQDPDMAYIIAAKSMAMTAIDLLSDGAKTALRIKRDFVPVYKDRDAWLAAWAELME
ncbi:MAG: hypothetical protein ACI3XT_08130, partial [Butyricicoccaceae bacterium]